MSGTPARRAAPAPALGEVGGPALLDQRDGLAVVFKPAGVPSEPAPGGGPALAEQVAPLLGVMARALHVVTRLDTPVSGVVLFSVAAAGHARAAALLQGGAVERRYLALLPRAPTPPSGTWSAPVPTPRGPRQAVTRYSVLAEAPLAVALVELTLETGRFHQIRAHAASAGVPLLGDVAHGGERRLVARSGAVHELRRPHLHAARLVVALPGGTRWVVTAPLPADLRGTWQAAGGDLAALLAAEAQP